MIITDKIITIGYNSCLRKWSDKNALYYSNTLSKDRVLLLTKSPLLSIPVPHSGFLIGKKFYKKFCINTLLIDTNEKTDLF